jgi:virulence factor Mce-like protein
MSRRRSAGRDRLMLELRRSTGPAILFLVLILAGIFTAVMVVRNLAGDKPWVDYASYKVGFDNVEGVVPGRHELRIAGVKAGSIKSSKLEGGRPVLTLNIEKKYAPLHTNAKVVIRPVTALEDMYVDITSRGTKSAPVLRPDQVLPETRTKSMVEVGRVLNVLEEDTRARFASLLDALGKGTDDRGVKLKEGFAQLGPFLVTATRLGDALTARRQNTARLVHNLGNITNVLARRDQQLAGFVDHGGRLLGELAQHDGTLSTTIGRLPGTLQNLQATFQNVRGTTTSLDAALRSLRPVAKSLPAGLDSLSDFSTDATPAVTSLRPSVRALKPLARELPSTAANGSAALTPLVPQMAQLKHGTTVLKPCLPLVEALINRVPSLTKYSGTQGSEGTIPDARAQATVDFGSIAQGERDPGYKPIVQPCYSDPSVVRNGNGMGVLTPIPSRDAAVSQEQK